MDKEVPLMIQPAPTAFWDDLTADLKDPAFRLAYDQAQAELADWAELTADTDDQYRADLHASTPVCTPRSIESWERDDIASAVRTAYPYPF